MLKYMCFRLRKSNMAAVALLKVMPLYSFWTLKININMLKLFSWVFLVAFSPGINIKLSTRFPLISVLINPRWRPAAILKMNSGMDLVGLKSHIRHSRRLYQQSILIPGSNLLLKYLKNLRGCQNNCYPAKPRIKLII